MGAMIGRSSHLDTEMEIALVIEDIAWLPLPNRLRVVTGPEVAPEELTKCAFLMGFTEDGLLVMANNRRRGIEIPGGHREKIEDELGNREETLEETARREGFEEARIVAQEIFPLGYEDLYSEGEAPALGKYPFPQSYQQFFCGIVELADDPEDFVENDEVLRPVLFTQEEAEESLRPRQLAMYRAARVLLFEDDNRPRL
jgi:8-oxo-dGTP pyrophosphatase MutT (NUDIX family)